MKRILLLTTLLLCAAMAWGQKLTRAQYIEKYAETAVRAAAASFREKPAFNSEKALMELGTGEALVSFLDEKGRPNVVERATILPPQSQMGPIDDKRRSAEIQYDELFGKYETAVDNESAYEIITADRQKEAEAAAAAAAEAQAKKEQEQAEKEKAKAEKAKQSRKKASAGARVTNSALNAVGREIGRSVGRGILGTIKKWF